MRVITADELVFVAGGGGPGDEEDYDKDDFDFDFGNDFGGDMFEARESAGGSVDNFSGPIITITPSADDWVRAYPELVPETPWWVDVLRWFDSLVPDEPLGEPAGVGMGGLRG